MLNQKDMYQHRDRRNDTIGCVNYARRNSSPLFNMEVELIGINTNGFCYWDPKVKTQAGHSVFISLMLNMNQWDGLFNRMIQEDQH